MPVGDLLGPVTVGDIAHGGHWICRVDGRVIFVRHGLSGDDVMIQITEEAKSFARADVAQVLTPGPHRVSAPCRIAGACGGCDFQHVAPDHQRELKRQVVAGLLAHTAGIDWSGEVEPVPPGPLGWRTRMRYQAAPDGRPGLRRHRSNEVVALPDAGCLIADPSIASVPRPVMAEVLAVAQEPSPVFLDAASAGRRVVRQQAAGREWQLAADGFWQSHAQAPDLLVRVVVEALAPQPGEVCFDLFCGVGLFAGAMVDRGCRVWGIEGNRHAVEFARRNVPQAQFIAGAVDRRLPGLPSRADLVVLDPPRSGAGKAVLERVAGLQPRAVAYVACDPASLARDLGHAQRLGFEVTWVRALDLFPMTHHVECVALLTRPATGT
ncbi:MAG: TRAM domain-containing protein [Micropruina sp.]